MAINREKVRAAAQKLLQKGQLDKAIREFERLVEDDPKDVRTLLKLGDLQTRAGENAAATATYTRVAHFYSEQGFFLKAVAVYKQILKIDPSILEVNVRLAELYQQLGLLSDANGQYRQLAQLYEQRGELDHCIGVLEKMIEADPENVASRIKLAELHAKQGQVDQAKREFAESAAYLKRQQRIEDWAKVAERIVFFHPDDVATSRELADFYVKRGDAKRALAKLQVCFKQNPRDVETLELLASAFKDLGQTQKAVSVYKELARVHQEASQGAYFADALSRALELDPDDAEARQALARARGAGASTGPSPDAGAVRPPPRPPARPTAGPAARPAAAAAGGQAVPPTDDAVSRLLVEADIYEKYGLLPKALEHVKKVLAVAPDSREAQERYRALLLEAGERTAAAAHLYDMAERARARGDEARARTDLEELLGLDPAHARGRQLLARLGGRPPATATATAAEPDPELDLELELAPDDDEVPEVELAGGPPDPLLTYEPSPEAAEIDLDADDEVPPPDAPAAPAVAPGAARSARPPAGDAVGRSRAGALRSAPATPAATAGRPGASTGEAAARTGARPSRPAARPSTSHDLAGTGIDDLDALLASAVPDRTRRPATSAASTGGSTDLRGETARPAREATGSRLDSTAVRDLADPEITDLLEAEAASSPTASIEVEVELDDSGLEGMGEPGAEGIDTEAPGAELAVSDTGSAGSGDEPEAEVAVPDTGDEPEAELAAEPEVAVPDTGSGDEPGAELAVSDTGSAGSGDEAAAALSAPEMSDAGAEAVEPTLAGEQASPAQEPGDAVTAPEASLAAAPDAGPAIEVPEDQEESILIERVDLAAELEDELAAASGDDLQVSLKDVFDEFKRGVAEQVEDSDFETHYNLGIAYKEMGLLADAIREFTTVRRAPEREVVALTMIGLCQLERGDLEAALRSFQEGLGSERATAVEAVALRYEIARAFEGMGRTADALRFYEKVQAMDAGFRDAGERVRELRALAADASAAGHELDPLLGDGGPEASRSKISFL